MFDKRKGCLFIPAYAKIVFMDINKQYDVHLNWF